MWSTRSGTSSAKIVRAAGPRSARGRAGEPAPHRLRHLDRLAESHRAQLVEGFGGIGLGRKDEAAALGGARRRVLEQARIVALHRAEVAEQRRREGVAIGIAHEAGECRKLLRRRGQRMGLLVGDHLQAMLDGAQERVGAFEIVAGIGIDPAAARELFERRERLAAAQRRVTAAGDQLLGLHEELDLADAAAAELDVVAFDRDFAAAAIRLNLPLHLVDVAEGHEIEIFAPDEGRKLRKQTLPGGDVAGAGTRLDHGGAFPVLSAALVIVEGRRGRHRDLRRSGVGTQPQVDAEDVALRRALLQQLDELAGQAHEQHRRLDAVHQRRRVGIEQHDEVDVARVVELARAHLAHGEHHIAGADLRTLGIGRREMTGLLGPGQKMADRKGNGGVGERGERLGDAHHAPHPADVGERDEERRLRLHLAQEAHRIGLRHGAGHFGGGAVEAAGRTGRPDRN